MVITRLILHNFGVYAGTNQFEFHNQKSVVLIGGMNGRGKTTFLESVLLALYGSNSFAYTESRYRTYGQYLQSYINKDDGTLFSYVELTFKMQVHAEEEYMIHREWLGGHQRIREKVSVQKNGIEDAFLTGHWAMFSESILPCGLSNFFFFDGEKIAELAAESTNAQMRDSIRALLGITVLDRLENDLHRILTNVSKGAMQQFDSDELERLRALKDQAETDLQAADDEIAEIERQLADNQKAIERAKNKYAAKGGDIVAQRQDLFNRRSSLSAQINRYRDDLANIAAGELPLCLVSDLLEDICVQAEKEYEQSLTQSALVRIDFMVKQFLSSSQSDSASVQQFVNFIKNSAKKEYVEQIYGLSDQAQYQVKHLQASQLKQAQQDTEETISKLQNLQAKIEEIDSYLSIDINEKTLARLYKQIKTLEQAEIELSTQLRAKQEKRTSINSNALRASREYNRFVEIALKNLESSDDSDRIAHYSQKAIKILEIYRIELQKNKVDLLAKTMTDCYKNIASKKNLIDQIKMDPVTLDFQYVNAEGEIVPKESLSAGEKQLMVISLLWSLAICSKWKLPVIIDTPLSRLDSAHRLSLIVSYFPYASDQTIILSTDSEIDQYYYRAMKESIGDEFTLVYDDERKCSTIKKGYFIGT